MLVERVTYDEEGLEETWNRLVAEMATRRAQLTWAWRNVWWQHFGRPDYEQTLQVRDGGRIVAIIPWLRRMTWALGLPLPVVRFTGGWLADYNQPIVEPGAEKAAITAALRFLMTQSRVLALDLVNLEPDSNSAFEEAAREAGLGVVSWPIVGCRRIRVDTDHTSYLASLSRNTRRDVTRKTDRVFDRLGAHCQVLCEPAEIAEWLPAIEAANRERWRAAGHRTSLFEDRRNSAFFQRMVAELAPRDMARLFLLTGSDGLIAYHFCYLYNGSLASWNAGWLPKFAEYSPGRVLEAQLIKWGFEQGVAEIDFMRGDYRYKSSWVGTTTQNSRLLIARPSWVGRVGRIIQKNLRDQARKLRARAARPEEG